MIKVKLFKDDLCTLLSIVNDKIDYYSKDRISNLVRTTTVPALKDMKFRLEEIISRLDNEDLVQVIEYVK